jgi:hypothetical protein
MSFPHYQHAYPGWGTPQVLSTLPPYSRLIPTSSINSVPLQPQLFNLNPRVTPPPCLPLLNAHLLKQGEAWIFTVPTQ